ncbi:MAG: hypothetical protein IPN38_19185 [Flavobacteriales bacterium]|nr:hypothetical protein [Flavobacteriales bacterium]
MIDNVAMRVFDISNPTAPSQIASVVPSGSPNAVAVMGNYSYVVTSSPNEMVVYNISDPAAPVQTSSIAVGSVPLSVAIAGNYAYVVNSSSNTMMAFNISDPAAPSLTPPRYRCGPLMP